MVLEVGTKFISSASFSRFKDKCAKEVLAIVEFLFPVIEQIFIFFVSRIGNKSIISSVSPEKDRITTTSLFVIAPRSPWLASAALI